MIVVAFLAGVVVMGIAAGMFLRAINNGWGEVEPMKNLDLRHLLWALLLGFAVGVPVGVVGRGCDWTPTPKPPVVVVPDKPKPDAVVYVYEKDDTAIPSEVMVMLDKLNRAGILATDIDDDVTDGDGQVPDQYKAAIDAARLAGLPAIVLLSKGEFVDYADLAKLESLLKDAQ